MRKLINNVQLNVIEQGNGSLTLVMLSLFWRVGSGMASCYAVAVE